MMWATSACPQNGRLPGVGGSREAMANDSPEAHCTVPQVKPSWEVHSQSFDIMTTKMAPMCGHR